MSYKIDLTNKRFGRLTVLNFSKKVEKERKDGRIENEYFWLCECDCGNFVEYNGSTLRNNSATSCGCKKIEVILEAGKKTLKNNSYEFYKDYFVGFDHNGNKFYCNLEDYENISKLYWFKTQQGYFSSKEKIFMHNYLLGYGIDHINRKRNDNRRENLRKCTPQENARNSSIGNNNTSGVIGVCKGKKNKWRAFIMVNYKQISLGSFSDKREAIISRLNAELKYFSYWYSPQRHLFEECGIEVGENVY